MTSHYAPVDPPIPRCPYCGKLSSSLSGLSTFRGQPKCDHRCRERAGDPPATDARDPYASLRRLSVELILTGSCPMTIQQQDSLRALLAERDALCPVPPASAPAATAGPTDEQLSAVLSRALRLKISPVLAAAIREELAARPATTAGTDFPRRNQMLKWTTGERAIQDAVDVVERMGADVRLTDAVILLGKARDRVADFVDGVAPESTVYPPAAPTGEEAETDSAMLSLLAQQFDHRGDRTSAKYLRDLRLRLTAQATELAALRRVLGDVMRDLEIGGTFPNDAVIEEAIHDGITRLKDKAAALAALRARVEELTALLRRVVVWDEENGGQQELTAYPDSFEAIMVAIRAALAPRQTTERQG